MQLRRARLDRRADVGHRRQFFVIDHNGFGGIACEILAFGDHDRHGLADETNGFRCHRGPRAHPHWRAVFRGDGPAADEIADLVIDDLLSGQNGEHARHLHRGR